MRIVILSERSESKDLSSFPLDLPSPCRCAMVQNPQKEPCTSNPFPLIRLRTLLRSLHQERSTSHFQSMASSLFHKTWGVGGIAAPLPVFRIFFHFAYGVSSLFLALTKTAGVWGH